MKRLKHPPAAFAAWIAIAGTASAGQCGYDYCWGAVATGADGASGYSYSHVTERNAHEVALEGCGSACDMVRTFYNSCGAIATGANGAWGWATGATRQTAQSDALGHCSRNGRDCHIRV